MTSDIRPHAQQPSSATSDTTVAQVQAESILVHHRLLDFITSWGYLGHIPKAPGTFGSLGAILLAAVLLYILPTLTTSPLWVVFCLVIAALGIYTSNLGLSYKIYGDKVKDPQCIVIDEACGIFISLWGIPYTPTNLFLAFILFRFFDILKPPPIRQLEQLPNGWGIMADDIAAGVMANILLRIIAAYVLTS